MSIKKNALPLYCLFFLTITPFHSSFAISSIANTITWGGCGISKKSYMTALAKEFEKTHKIKIDLQGGGATKGIRGTASHDTMMGGSCRMRLPEYDTSETYVKSFPIAWDALAVIVNKKNKMLNITTEQIKQIYTGKITNWAQLDGEYGPINLYIREGKLSGVGYTIRQYIFKDSQKDFVTNKKFIMKSSGPLEKGVENDPNAIAITGVSSARKRDVKILSFEGFSPTYENVKNGNYLYYRPLYLITQGTPKGNVKKFLKFAQSKRGRQIIRDNETVPYRDALHLMTKMSIYGFGVK